MREKGVRGEGGGGGGGGGCEGGVRREKGVRGKGGGRKGRRHSWYKNGSDTHGDSTTASNKVLGTQAPT